MKNLALAFVLAFLSATAFAQTPAPPSAVLSWTAPTSFTDGSVISGAITYNVYQGLTATSLVKVASGVTAATATITTGLTDGVTYFWAVTAVVGGNESAQSTAVSKTFAAGTPSPVINLTVK